MNPLGTYHGAAYATSTYSHPSDCIAVARPSGQGVAVKDSKDPQGPRLEFSREAWGAFLADLPAAA